MIRQSFVVVCDFCGTVAMAEDEGTQRDSSWVPPRDWSYGKANKNVHLCPRCTALLEKKEKEENENRSR